MNTKRNIKKNYIFNLSYQLLLIIVPLLVTPYISRVLTASAIGQYSFSFSIITYFKSIQKHVMTIHVSQAPASLS